jgi:predicted RND superfamily exporter protein
VTGSSALRALETRLRGAVAAAGLPPPLRVDVTGNAIVLNRGADAIAGKQLGSVALTTVTILVLVTAAFRSLSIGLVAMAPNLVPVILFFGLLGGGIATLSLPTSLIGCVALGIAIDDTAHFLVSYRRVRGAGTPAGAAIASCVRELGQPIVVTSLMLSAGYLVLALSSFTTVRQFGWLSALTMQICLWGDLLMLPSILVRARI